MKAKKTISIIFPCLNEEQTLGKCIDQARAALKRAKLSGEIIVVDNGSTDKSIQIAKSKKINLVSEPLKGYGRAYLTGFKRASGKYIVIADCDGTYTFDQLDKFIDLLEKGFGFVNGSRIKGEIKKGAMPFLHRYIGVPLLSGLVNFLYGSCLSDAHCGIRAFRKSALNKMDLQTPGMEFASEIIIKATLKNIKSTEIPVSYLPRLGKSKLRMVRDGFRHLFYIVGFKLKIMLKH